MEIIDKSLVSKQDRKAIMINEVLEDLVNKKEHKFDKYVPDEIELKYLSDLRKSRPTGLSKDNSFVVAATFPIEEHIKMTNIHGPHWADKPGVLADFMRKNPQYCVGNAEGMEKFAHVDGPIEVKSNASI